MTFLYTHDDGHLKPIESHELARIWKNRTPCALVGVRNAQYLWETMLVLIKNIPHKTIITQQLISWYKSQKLKEETQTRLHTHVHPSVIPNSEGQKPRYHGPWHAHTLQGTQKSMHACTRVYTHTPCIVSLKYERNSDISYNMDQTWKCYVR